MAEVPTTLKMARAQGFEVQWDARDFTSCAISPRPRLTMQENGTDIPIDVAPGRVRIDLVSPLPPFYINGEKAPATQEHNLELIPLQDASVPDFNVAYPNIASVAKELRSLLKASPVRVDQGDSIPEWNDVDMEQTIHAQIHYVDTPWCSGVLFLTQHIQEMGAPITNHGIAAIFQGLSKDGKFLVAATFPVSHASLTTDPPDLIPEAQVKDTYRRIEDQLNRASEDSFSPPLSRIIRLVISVKPVTGR